MQLTSAMACFWIERATAIEQFLWLPYLFLSGMVAPLDVYPPALRDFALLTPFPYLSYIPARLLLDDGPVHIGQGDTARTVLASHALTVVLLWLVGFLLLNRLLWRLGLRRYSAMGA
jgi:ABC-2 type transport system permease protein